MINSIQTSTQGRGEYMEVNNSLRDVRHISKNPFFTGTDGSEERKQNLVPPSYFSALNEMFYCVRRATHTTTMGFCDPTLLTCTEELKLRLRACYRWGHDKEATQFVLTERMNTVDLSGMPWSPSGSYLEYLKETCRHTKQLEETYEEVMKGV
eukprot:Tbor_TRINITY_DN5225_c0_g1::TRINITY_DN5225_c0_g1_i1::g.16319::m.16319